MRVNSTTVLLIVNKKCIVLKYISWGCTRESPRLAWVWMFCWFVWVTVGRWPGQSKFGGPLVNDEFWWVLMSFDEFWWVLMSLDRAWWVWIGRDVNWQRFDEARWDMTINDAMGSMPGKRHGLDRTLTCNDFCKDFYINFRSSFSLNEKIIFIKRPMTNFYFFLLYELVIKLCSLLKNRAEMRAKQLIG